MKSAAYEQIMLSRSLRGEIPVLNEIPDPSGVGTGPFGEGSSSEPIRCFTGEAESPLAEGQVIDATLMLMATYETTGPEPSSLAAYFGTGTLIKADDGLNQVLTAAHVTLLWDL